MVTESLGYQCLWHIYQACGKMDVKRYTPAELRDQLIQCLKHFPALAAQVAALGFAGMRELHQHLRLRQAETPYRHGRRRSVSAQVARLRRVPAPSGPLSLPGAAAGPGGPALPP